MIIEWLQERVAIEEIRKMVEECPPIATFRREGFSFLDKVQEGDELWKFKSPQETWEHRCGRAGYCIVRDKKVIAFLVTALN